MNARKIGFWRWLLNGVNKLPSATKEFCIGLYEIFSDPITEATGGFVFFLVSLACLIASMFAKLFPWWIFLPSTVLFFFLMLHGWYRELTYE